MVHHSEPVVQALKPAFNSRQTWGEFTADYFQLKGRALFRNNCAVYTCGWWPGECLLTVWELAHQPAECCTCSEAAHWHNMAPTSARCLHGFVEQTRTLYITHTLCMSRLSQVLDTCSWWNDARVEITRGRETHWFRNISFALNDCVCLCGIVAERQTVRKRTE